MSAGKGTFFLKKHSHVNSGPISRWKERTNSQSGPQAYTSKLRKYRQHVYARVFLTVDIVIELARLPFLF